MTSNAAANNIAAVAAAIRGFDEASFGALVSSDGRPPMARPNSGRYGQDPPTITQPSHGKLNRYPSIDHQGVENLNIHDETMKEDTTVAYGTDGLQQNKDIAKARARRASEGAYLSKTDGKRASGELRCEKCGKGYKHSSCLSKHLLVFPTFILPHTFSSQVQLAQLLVTA